MPTLPTPTTLRAASTKRKRSSRCRRSADSVSRYPVDRRADRLGELVGLVLREQVGHGHDQRRLGDDPRLAVDDRRQLLERPQAVLRPGLGHVLLVRLELGLADLGAVARPDVVLVHARVPQVHRVHPGELGHRRPVRRRCLEVDHVALPGGQAEVATGDGEAGHEPLEVPLERAGQRLVEVVDAERQPAVGRGEAAEVGQVGVPAQLRVQARARGPAEIHRHQRSCAPEERERRHEHAPVLDRDQLGHPRRVLLRHHLDRVAAVRDRFERGVRRPGHLDPLRPSPGHPLVPREVGHHRGRHGEPLGRRRPDRRGRCLGDPPGRCPLGRRLGDALGRRPLGRRPLGRRRSVDGRLGRRRGGASPRSRGRCLGGRLGDHVTSFSPGVRRGAAANGVHQTPTVRSAHHLIRTKANRARRVASGPAHEKLGAA